MACFEWLKEKASLQNKMAASLQKQVYLNNH